MFEGLLPSLVGFFFSFMLQALAACGSSICVLGRYMYLKPLLLFCLRMPPCSALPGLQNCTYPDGEQFELRQRFLLKAGEISWHAQMQY